MPFPFFFFTVYVVTSSVKPVVNDLCQEVAARTPRLTPSAALLGACGPGGMPSRPHAVALALRPIWSPAQPHSLARAAVGSDDLSLGCWGPLQPPGLLAGGRELIQPLTYGAASELRLPGFCENCLVNLQFA